MNNITISIIIPVYNVENYVEECIESVIHQIQDTDEIIIIDDGSIDNSYEICRRIINKKENILVIQQKNKGLGATRNYGLSIAKGEYVLFLDSDDMLKRRTLSELRNILSGCKVDMLLFDADIFGEDNLTPQKNSYDRKRVGISKILSGKEMFLAMYPQYYRDSAVLSIYRREFLRSGQITFPEGILHEDIPFSFETMMKAARVLHVPSKYYLRRYRANSITTSAWSYERWYGKLIGSMDTWEYVGSEPDIISRFPILANMVAIYIFGSLKRILETGNIDFIETSGWTYGDIINSFLQVWSLYYENDIDSFVKWKGTLYIIDFIKDHKIVSSSELINNMLDEVSKTIEKYEYHIREKLDRLPFDNKEICVGIYGMGRHTKELLKQYRRLVGEISCEYFFIDSYIAEKDTVYLCRPVININEVRNKADVIVISSFLYQKDMNDKINEVLGYEFPRVCLYDKNDVIGYFG